MFTDVLAVTPDIIKRSELITCCPWRIFRVVRVAAVYLHNSSSDMINMHCFTALALIAENRDFSYVDNDILSQEAAIFASAH